MDDLAVPLLIEWQAKHNVLPHRQRLAPPVLRYIGDPPTTFGRALGLVHVAQDSREQGGFASTHTAHHSDELSRLHGELRHVELEATVASVCVDTVALHRGKHVGRGDLRVRVMSQSRVSCSGARSMFAVDRSCITSKLTEQT